MNEKTVLVTGATGAIGQAIAMLLAQQRHKIMLVCRDKAKAQRALEEVQAATRNQQLRFEIADLSRKVEIEALAARWNGPLHVLINNAAQSPPRRSETPEGIELQFATNVLSYFWMCEAFRPILKASAPARIVNVASYWAGDLELDDFEFTRRRYNNNTSYRQSKQANRMLTAVFADRFNADGITVNACHPGDVKSNLSRDLGFGGHESPAEGAATPVWLATDPVLEGVSGKYFEHQREVRCPFAADRAASERLFELCSKY